MIKDYTAEDLQNAFDRGREIGRKESQRPWTGLTDEEREKIVWPWKNLHSKTYLDLNEDWLISAIEAKLRSKNT